MELVIIPKNTGPFWDSTGEGCIERSSKYFDVQCHYLGFPDASVTKQATLLRNLILNPSLYNLSKIPDGIAIAVLDEEITGEAINFVSSSGVPIITYDADAPSSNREAFVGTDNYAFGLQLARVLHKLKPGGKNYGIITAFGPNLQLRVNGIRDRLHNDYLHPTKWKEVEYSPLNCENNVTKAIELMYQYAADENIDAIVPVGGWPMFAPDLWKKFIDLNPRVFTVVADTVDEQIQLMNQGYVNGLVGQMPFEMGSYSVDTLVKIIEEREKQGVSARQTEEIVVTPLLDVSRVPVTLPPVTLDNHYLGSLAVLGYVMFSITALCSISFAAWVYVNRENAVLRKSQPFFLFMICIGTFIMGCALIPLTKDDENNSQRSADMACMAVPWLLTLGFTTAFSALFAKTWRIYRIMKNSMKFKRVKVTVQDVLIPYVALMCANLITLICWSAISPSVYIRQPLPGTDDWNRVIETYGSCSSSTSKSNAPYLAILITVNGILLIVANIYAYLSRHFKTEFSESKCIAIIMSSLLQVFLIGLPIAALISEFPEGQFVTWSLLIFICCMDILFFIFIPKLRAVWKNVEDQGNKAKRPGSEFTSGLEIMISNSVRRLSITSKKSSTRRLSLAHDSLVSDVDAAFFEFIQLIDTMSEKDRKTLRDFLIVMPSMTDAERKEVMDSLTNTETSSNENSGKGIKRTTNKEVFISEITHDEEGKSSTESNAESEHFPE